MIFLTSEVLDNQFNIIKKLVDEHNIGDDINNYLPKIALYSHIIEQNNAMNQGTHVEDCIEFITGAERLKNDGKSIKGLYGNCDLKINGFAYSVKSSIKKSGVLKVKTDGAQGRSKIFDTSRKPSFNLKESEVEKIVKDKLIEVCWEIPFLFYLFDMKLNRGCLFSTSLSEIALANSEGEKTEDEIKELIEKLFSNNGAAHFFISIDAAYQIAKNNNRVINFSITEKEREEYLERMFKKERIKKGAMIA